MTSLLEKAIEIEGLIRIIRDGHPSAETYAMLKRKTSELAADSAALQPLTERKTFSTASDRAQTVRTSKEADELVCDTDDIILSFDEETPAAAINLSSDDNANAEQAADTPTETVAPKTAPASLATAVKNLKSVFSLNDRYLYSRELFGGNMKMFDATLDFLEGVENFSDIEDYFFNELEWDPDNTTAETFLETLRPHFRE